MNSRYSTGELPQTKPVRKSLAKMQTSHGAATRRARAAAAGNGLRTAEEPQAHPVVTHRLRLFEYHSEALEPNEHIYISVWDSKQNPVTENRLPKGSVVRIFEGKSVTAIEADANRFCRDQLGTAEIVDWRDRGTI